MFISHIFIKNCIPSPPPGIPPSPRGTPFHIWGTNGPISMKFHMYHSWVHMNGLQPKILTISPPPRPPKGVFEMQYAHHLLSSIFWKKVLKILRYMGLSFVGGNLPPPNKK